MSGVVFAYNPKPGSLASLPAEVAGASFIVKWASVEPKQGQYDWSAIDAFLAECHGAGKLAMLRVEAGEKSPSWVPNMVQISFTAGGPLGQLTVTCPIPWDPAFLSAWTTFLAAYGARYNGDARVAVVQMPGAGRIGEMNLADDGQWITKRGYTDAKIIGAWRTVIDAYLAAFPGKQLALDLGEPLHQGSNAMQSIHDYALTHAPKIAMQQNGLKAGTSGKYAQILASDSAKTPTGWQMWGSMAQGAGPLGACLAVATQTKASYLEAYAVDCTAANAAALGAWAKSAPSLPTVAGGGHVPERRVAKSPRRVEADRRVGDRRKGTHRTGVADRRHA